MENTSSIEQLKSPIQPLEGGFIPAVETQRVEPISNPQEVDKESPNKQDLITRTQSSENERVTEDPQVPVSTPTFDSKAPPNGDFMSHLVTNKNSGLPVPA